MRKIFWFEMASLDGYHESEQAGLDWHHVDAEFLDFVRKQPSDTRCWRAPAAPS
jgi:hypothetical protein